MTELQHDLWLVSPEICLSLSAMLIQMIGLNKSLEKFAGWFGILGIIFSCFLLNKAMMMGADNSLAFSSGILFTEFIKNYMLLILSFAAGVIFLYMGYVKAINQPLKSEYVVFILLSLAGAGVAISSANLIVLFIGLELQALIAYMLACFDRDKSESSEASLKYFILGALASCLILLGMSFLYGFSGSILFHDIIEHELNLGISAGTVLLLCGFMFKLSSAPFHMWTPDVYEGAPLPSVAFFSTVQKIVIVSTLINLLYVMTALPEFTGFIKAFAILSMLVGSIGGVMQESVKRLLAYSTILNLGFVLIPFAHSENMGSIPLVYLTIYAVAVIGLLALIIIALGSKSDSVRLSDLRGFAQNNKKFAAFISILIFSLIGLPPFAGFFGKYYIILGAISNEEYLLAAFALLSSVIAAFYYLKIVKSMYFDEALNSNSVRANYYLLFIALGSVIFTLIFIFTG